MRKTVIRILTILTLVMVPLMFAGCNKTVNQGGEGTQYPFTWSVASNGTVTVKLNGSVTPDYHWTAVSDNESVMIVKQKGTEKKGKATFKISPKSEGTATIRFVREREVVANTYTEQEGMTSEELESIEAEVAERDAKEAARKIPKEELEGQIIASEQPSDEEPSEVPSNVIPAQEESSNIEETRRTPKDMVSNISIYFSVTPNGKKYSVSGTVMETEEQSGIISESELDMPYQIWQDESGNYRINLSSVKGGWLVFENSEYTGVIEEIVDEETGMVTGYSGIIPEVDEEGYAVVIDVTDNGGVYDNSFEITPLAPSKGTLFFSSPVEKKRVVVDFEIAQGNVVSITGHRVEEYTPTKEELSQVEIDPDK